jgi:hypothetical protein
MKASTYLSAGILTHHPDFAVSQKLEHGLPLAADECTFDER